MDGYARTGNGWGAAGVAANYPLRAFDFLPRATTADYPVWFGFAVTYVNPPSVNYPTLMQLELPAPKERESRARSSCFAGSPRFSAPVYSPIAHWMSPA